MVVVDDFTRYTWMIILREKSDAFEQAQSLCKKLQNEKGSATVRIRNDHGRGFENCSFE